MTKTLVASAVTLLAVALVPACGGSTSSSNSNDAGTSNKPPPPSDAGTNPLTSPALSMCSCTGGQTCCYNAIAGSGVCQDPSATCTGSALKCSKPSDCSGSSVCCIMSGGAMAGGFNSSCVSDPSQCMVADDGGGGGNPFGNFAAQLCDSTHPCPMGDNCFTMMGGSFCINPAMFGMFGMFGMMGMSEAGTQQGTADAASE